MLNRCFVPLCKSGYPGFTKSTGAYRTMFKAPANEEELKKWQNAIPRKDAELKSTSHVCSNHFEDDDLLKGRWTPGPGGNFFYPWNNWGLKKDALLRIFPSNYLS